MKIKLPNAKLLVLFCLLLAVSNQLTAQSSSALQQARQAKYDAILLQMQSEVPQPFYCVQDNLGFTWQVTYLGILIDSSLFAGICTDCDGLWFMGGAYDPATSGIVLTYTSVDSLSCPDPSGYLITGFADGSGGLFGIAFNECSFFPSLYSANILGGFCGFGKESIGSAYLAAEGSLQDSRPMVYPNPATNIVSIDLGTADEGNVTVAVYDNAGRQVARMNTDASGSPAIQWDASELPAGLYHVICQTENGFRQERLVIE